MVILAFGSTLLALKAALVPAAMIGGYLGARYTNRFGDKTLKRIIGIVLIVVAITMFVRAFEL